MSDIQKYAPRLMFLRDDTDQPENWVVQMKPHVAGGYVSVSDHEADKAAALAQQKEELTKEFSQKSYCQMCGKTLDGYEPPSPAIEQAETRKWRELAEQQNAVIELCATALTSVVPCSERSESDYRLKIAHAAFEVGRATTAYNAAKEEGK